MAKLSTTGFFVFLTMMCTGIIIYLRLWNVEADLHLEEDTRVDRIVFEQAQSEAFDEAAEWRRKYDEEAEKYSETQQKLGEVTQILKEKTRQVQNLETHITELQKENHELLEDVRRLKQELQDKKLKFEKTGLKAV